MSNDKTLFMTNFTTVIATLDEIELFESLVKKLVRRQFDTVYSNRTPLKNWQAVETSSAETDVRGTISFSDEINNENAAINVPFITSMLFTCIKTKADSYELLWSSSLS
jgi:hypothetical protein